MMQFKILENLEGEHAHCNACKIEMTVFPTAEEIAGVATIDPSLFWKFLRSIKRAHPKRFERPPKSPEGLMTIALIHRTNPDTDECLSLLCHIDGEMYALAPRISEEYQKVFDFHGKCTGPVIDEHEIREKAISDYHAYLSDLADEYWAQAESRKNETDRSSAKLMMELRHMHAHYSSMADEVLQYLNRF